MMSRHFKFLNDISTYLLCDIIFILLEIEIIIFKSKLNQALAMYIMVITK